MGCCRVRKMAEPVPQTILPAVRRAKSKSTPTKSGLDQRLLRPPANTNGRPADQPTGLLLNNDFGGTRGVDQLVEYLLSMPKVLDSITQMWWDKSVNPALGK